jgi:PadR family transcriptional regulator PadR
MINDTIDFTLVFNKQYSEPHHKMDRMLSQEDDPADPREDAPAEVQARKFQRELSAGLTSLVLLSVLAEADSDLYGYEIARRLSSDDLPAAPFKQGALYPVLRNMSGAGLLSSRVVPSYSGPPRRYYRITPLGREVLQAWRDTWIATRSFVDTVVQPSAVQEMPS